MFQEVHKVVLSLWMLAAIDEHCFDLLIHQGLQNSEVLLFRFHVLSGVILDSSSAM